MLLLSQRKKGFVARQNKIVVFAQRINLQYLTGRLFKTAFISEYIKDIMVKLIRASQT